MSKKAIDTMIAALIGAGASAAVGAAIERANDFSGAQRIFYMEARRPPLPPSDKHLAIISLINPGERSISNFSVSFASKERTDPAVVDQFGDTDFLGGGTRPEISAADGIINLRFGRLPGEARYTLLVQSTGEFEIGTSSERAKVFSDGGKLEIIKLKRGYYRSFVLEPWYFFAAGLFGGAIAVFAFFLLRKRRRSRSGEADSPLAV